MICITVTPTSRTLAPAYLFNAFHHCELVELCLDHFVNEPNIGDLIRVIDEPILVSCRRERDGGAWSGTEQQRIHLLREAIVAGPAYVELDDDIAAGIPRFGKTKRVVSHTSLKRPLSKLDDIYERCRKAGADVVKLTGLTEDLDAAWPLLAAAAQKRDVPVVGAGIGPSGLGFSLLGQKYGAPWIYAALERGMEAWPGQPTVRDLKEIYCCDDIERNTRFVGVIGSGDSENQMCRILNSAFRSLEKPVRCLPLIPGDLRKLPAMLSRLKIAGLLVDPAYQGELLRFANSADKLAVASGRVDVLIQVDAGWKGCHTTFRAVEAAGAELIGAPDWVGRGMVNVVGQSRMARGAAEFFASHGCAVSLTSPSDNNAVRIAREAGVRYVPWNAAHDVRCDTLVIADSDQRCGTGRGELNPTMIRERMNVVDFSFNSSGSDFEAEAAARGARYIGHAEIFRKQMVIQFRQLTGLDFPVTVLQDCLAEIGA